MKYLILGIGFFIIIYGMYLITIILNKKVMKKFDETKQAQFFIVRYKLDVSKLNIKSFANSVALTNSFIISLTILITELVDNYLLKLLIGLVTLIPLVLITYEIIGKIYKKKEGKKNV